MELFESAGKEESWKRNAEHKIETVVDVFDTFDLQKLLMQQIYAVTNLNKKNASDKLLIFFIQLQY